MAIRILSGVIVPHDDKKSNGRVWIEFNPHQVRGELREGVEQPRDADGSELVTIGPNLEFRGTPCKEVSLRHIKFTDRTQTVHDHKDFNLGDDFVPTDGPKTALSIVWDARGESAAIEEISYMIIGEV